MQKTNKLGKYVTVGIKYFTVFSIKGLPLHRDAKLVKLRKLITSKQMF